MSVCWKTQELREGVQEEEEEMVAVCSLSPCLSVSLSLSVSLTHSLNGAKVTVSHAPGFVALLKVQDIKYFAKLSLAACLLLQPFITPIHVIHTPVLKNKVCCETFQVKVAVWLDLGNNTTWFKTSSWFRFK